MGGGEGGGLFRRKSSHMQRVVDVGAAGRVDAGYGCSGAGRINIFVGIIPCSSDPTPLSIIRYPIPPSTTRPPTPADKVLLPREVPPGPPLLGRDDPLRGIVDLWAWYRVRGGDESKWDPLAAFASNHDDRSLLVRGESNWLW